MYLNQPVENMNLFQIHIKLEIKEYLDIILKIVKNDNPDKTFQMKNT